MGCSTSTQTSAVDTTRPSAKLEESNGASTTGAANENGNLAEDSETIPDQTPAEGSDAKPGDEPAEEPAVTAASADTTAATPPAAEESQDAAGSPPAETSAAAGDSTAETAASSSEAEAPAPEPEKGDAGATDSEPKTDETPAPSE
ncbi:skin secretory protein xP2 [Pundamilia nyererei]|uniref:Skin secretory protein xP2 n=1 Tax=Pundamilia nyererei TaxID=303518 RepID=A0A9Y3R6L4_9CICH|nr:PREDICTED: skin secretory protein xP2-like [Pundamilia nyererei]XP_005917587.1 skin secretory protein xP2 [Haplochromis burtoni]XP_042074845.1 skin secretory protein xP2 [Haplochromis burtoni]